MHIDVGPDDGTGDVRNPTAIGDPIRQQRAERLVLEDSVLDANVPRPSGNNRSRSDRRADAGNALDRRRVSFDARVGIDDAPLDDCVRTDGCVLAETDIRSDDGTRFDDAILIDDDRFTNHR